jgi:cyclic beta-1,2-glucan synthetase
MTAPIEAPHGALEMEARALADSHGLSDHPPRSMAALAQLRHVPDWLAHARSVLGESEGAVAKAAEWLLDNEYLVARGVRQIEKDLPKGFYARLPALSGSDAGRPRMWSIARALLRASRLQLSVPTVTRFLDAYQERTPLTIAELWALPTFLRLGCLEVLFAAFERLDRSLRPPLAIDDLPDIALEDTECVGRAISNLRTIASISWKDFFCRTSRVEAILREDPARVYQRMDFETRDAYRRAIEQMARRSPHSEVEVAERAVACARQAVGGSLRHTDVGYWLVDEGVEEFERSIGCRPELRQRARRWFFRHAAILYLTALVAATAATIVVPAWHLATHGTTPWATALILGAVLLPASTLAVTCILWLVTVLVPPRTLPKLDFDAAIPDECRTAVVMPTLVGTIDDARRQLERLELHYLANPDRSTQFVLLSDFPDALREHEPSDRDIVTSLVAEVRRLNQKYPSKPFHMLHRPRRFNAAEGVWMAWERKRGKLEDFNRLLAGDPATNFTLHEGNRSHLDGVRYVVTLDVDTVLQKGTLARLVGTLAHPLNRAEFDNMSGRVRTGYTVLQPRIEISPECGNRSQFARWFTGDTAIDIYSRAVSDVYQDLFGSGIYVGKGAYDVEAFRRSLDGRVPENALASHDLFEGIHGRAALATDIVLYETFPRQYLEFARRQHRWIRGDWQLLPWLGRSVPGTGGRRLRNRLAWIDRWKIVDNLRRSLLPPALLTMLVAGWLILPGHPAVWTVLGVLAPSGLIFTDLVTGFARGRRRSALAGTFQRLSDHTGRWLLLLVFLPHDAAVAADAIARTLVRVVLTRRHLLQWTSAARTSEELAAGDTRRFIWRQMWIAPVLAVVVLVAVVTFRAQALPGALPLLVMWFIAPEVAYVLGHPRRLPGRRLDADDRVLLRRIARRTWRYFEVFVGPDDQWLPPDNFQEQPRGEVAHRTSPTNIGMMFLSSLAACDLGYVGLDDLASRLTNSLDTLARMDRYRGHLFNWYDTRTLEPLNPHYVSTVDSGNLAVSLLALKEGCLELAEGPALRSQQWRGLSDVLKLLDDAVERLDLGREEALALRGCLDAIETRVTNVEDDPSGWWSTVRDLSDRDVPDLDRHLLEAVAEKEGHPATLARVREVRIWLERLHHHARSMDRECRSLFPWLLPLTQAPPALAGVATAVTTALPPTLRLNEIADHGRQVRELVRQSLAAQPPADDDGRLAWSIALSDALDRGEQAAAALRVSLVAIAARAENLALAMDFGLLYDKDLRLFHIGYNVTADRLDSHHYDLLASEARLASLFAIAKGDAPVEHWFHLGRATTVIARHCCLLSWGGSMFEYLMPRLLMRSEAGSLLAESEITAVDAQRRYARTLSVPWGMSESGLSATDSDHTYQYRSFGVPALGLRRGLATETVVAPYASVLALPVDADAAMENLRRLEELGLIGDYGFYEAADFTPDRTPAGSLFVPVLSYMAHHQGMSLAALDNALCDDALVRRAETDRRLRSVSLLLHERVPIDVPPETTGADAVKPRRPAARSIPRIEPWTPVRAGAFPEMHVLGNGRLATWISDSGAGTLRWQAWNLTRWTADPTRDDTGLWMYVRDEETGALASVSRQPCGAAPDAVDVVFYPHLAEFHRRDGDLAIRVEVVVAPADDIEIRHVTIINDGDQVRRLMITTCGEVVLAKAADHERHPAFSKLFVHSEFIPPLDGLLFLRQPRSPDERPPVLLHRFVSDDPNVRFHGIETDRAAFVGRGRTYRDPVGAVRSDPTSSGFTLDPILALQISAEIEPSASVRLAFITAVSGSRESVLELAERYQTMNAVEWVMAEAEAEVGRELQRFGIEPGQMTEMQTLASLLVYRHRALRCAAETIAANRLGQPRLWGLGLSGDLPILLVKLRTADDIDLLRDLARAHAFWRRRGLRFDLVVLRHGASGYDEPVGEKLRVLLYGLGTREQLGQTAGIHFLSADHVGADERRLLDVVANVVLDTDRGTLGSQLARVHEETPTLPRFLPGGPPEADVNEAPAFERPVGLLFDNGLGGFSADGREYVIHLGPGDMTPAPWCNVLANPDFGTLVTESGGGFTWAGNSGEHRLTPWTNDPVSDPPGEALYVRDEETAAVWTPTPQPAGAGVAHQVRYGAGYARWRSQRHGLSQDLLVFVAPDDPVKIIRLHVRNHRHRPRRLTVTYYAEWVLGASREQSKAVLVPEYEASQRAMLVRNPWQAEFANRVAFLAASRTPHGITSDRTEFIGREGTLRRPAALERWGLAGHVQPGQDPCAAFQVHLDLPADAEDEVVFVLGEGRDREQALELAARWREPSAADAAWERLARFWDDRLDVVHVETPDSATNVMLNRWLLYQAIASRMFGRTGFYQSSGAIGFRDQLQDALALVMVEPARCRAHLLDCAGRQFDEGDVLHWWHPPMARGVRTRCSDDLLWLPFAIAHYVSATGDAGVLDEQVPFLKGRPLLEHEGDLYAVFESGDQSVSLFEHCERALERGLTRGAHGLPLIGSGDWNDGMNRVGRLGRGESVWLAWFAIATTNAFADICHQRGHAGQADRWRRRARELAHAAEEHGWDGEWYRRAFDDEGRPWGSRENTECRIDSIAQSWAVISRGGSTTRTKCALVALERELIDYDERIVRLLSPPFTQTGRDPGYIKAYPPGIRENGGQYTHAAIWVGWAFAELGDGERAARVFDLLNPIGHASAAAAVQRYRVEPYVVAADVAGVPPYVGRGGWTWYTGSAAWLWRLGVERILGLRPEAGGLRIEPCLPRAWRRVDVRIRRPGGELAITIENPDGVETGIAERWVDGVAVDEAVVAFPADGRERRVIVRLGAEKRPARLLNENLGARNVTTV